MATFKGIDLSIDLKNILDGLKTINNPEDIFGDLGTTDSIVMLQEIRLKHKQIANTIHPDHHNNSKEAHEAMSLLNVWRDKAEQKVVQGLWGEKDSGISIKTSKLYKNVKYVTTGDICDIYLAQQEDGPRAIIKAAIDRKDQSYVNNEATILQQLWEPTDAEAKVFQKYIPKFLEQTIITVDKKEQLANIIEIRDGGFTLEQVHQKYKMLDPRHVAWILKRILEGVGWVNLKQKIVHGAIIPSHIVVFPKDHGAHIIDWSYAVPVNKKHIRAISTNYKDFYPPEVFNKVLAQPSIDIYMAAKCAVYLLGGDVKTNYIPPTIHPLFSGFLKACLLTNPMTRYTDTWEAVAQFTDNLRTIYGPRKFVDLDMEGGSAF